MPRTTRHAGRIEVAVGVLVLERCLFLIQRSPRMPYGGFLWGCFGGRVEPGETIAAAAIREAREEVGLEIDPLPHFMCETVHDPPAVERACRVSFLRVEAGVPIAPGTVEPFRRIEEVELRLDPREVAGAGWFSASEIRAMARARLMTAANCAVAERLALAADGAR